MRGLGAREVDGLAAGYVSRLLDAFDRDALVDRRKRGQVESVDIAGLLRGWAETYDVLKTNLATTYLAPSGAQRALSHLAEADEPQRAAVRGHSLLFESRPWQLPRSCSPTARKNGRLRPRLGCCRPIGRQCRAAAPFDQVVWQRAQIENGLTSVAPSQTVVDCLTGTGRMPAEGTPSLRWMLKHDATCRNPSIDAATETMTPQERQSPPQTDGILRV